jgi:hypothetical protein
MKETSRRKQDAMKIIAYAFIGTSVLCIITTAIQVVIWVLS